MSVPTSPADMQAYILEQLKSRDDKASELDVLCDLVARKLETALSAKIEKHLSESIGLETGEHGITTTAEALEKFGEDCAVALIGEEADRQIGMICGDPMTVAILLGVSFGADAETELPPISGELSPIETDIFETNAESFVAAMADIGMIDAKQQLLFACNGVEARKETNDFRVMSFTYSVTLGAHSGTLTVMVSELALSSERKLCAPENDNTSKWNASLKAGIMQTNIGVDAIVSVAPRTLAELNELKPGDIIEFPAVDPHEASLAVGNQPLFTGRFGRMGNKYTILVDKPVKSRSGIVDHIVSTM
ncbi:MAG: FliM/FliN family flagellar motor switch protein [Rhizobiaceae bacterium]